MSHVSSAATTDFGPVAESLREEVLRWYERHGKPVEGAAGRITLELPGELAPGDYTLRLDFTGKLSDLMEGMYRSRFTDDDGREHPSPDDPAREHGQSLRRAGLDASPLERVPR